MNAKNQRALELACATLELEADAIRKMRDRLAQEGQSALLLSVDLLEQCRGRIVVSGIGKSGHIARKIAATFASTGSPAFFVHPAEASHGDLGMLSTDDVLIFKPLVKPSM